MPFLLISAVLAAVILLYITDRAIKACARVRRYRAMSDRLDAAAARTEVQQGRRKRSEAAGAALTSVIPAINWPPLALPGVTKQPPDTDPASEAEASNEARPGHDVKPTREARHGHEGTGPREHQPGRPGAAHPRPRPAERSGGAANVTGP